MLFCSICKPNIKAVLISTQQQNLKVEYKLIILYNQNSSIFFIKI